MEVNIRKIFGENVKYYRKMLGLSQEQLAEKLEVSPNHISVIETGTKFVTYKHLEKLIEVFNVTPDALFYAKSTKSIESRTKEKILQIIKSEFELSIENIKANLTELCLKNVKNKSSTGCEQHCDFNESLISN